VEVAIRTPMTELDGSLLQQLPAADTGHCGPRIDCGARYFAEFIGYRDKWIDTVLGRITLRAPITTAGSANVGSRPPRRRPRRHWRATSINPGHLHSCRTPSGQPPIAR
jgi:hypothetical protein